MKNRMDLSLTRFLMILSLVLLGVVEYLWINNEFRNKYRDMEDQINHVMFSQIRDIEDSIIFARLDPSQVLGNQEHEFRINIQLNKNDSLVKGQKTFTARARDPEIVVTDSKPRMRGLLLEKISNECIEFDTTKTTIGGLVMHHLQLDDSTGEYAGYKIISWQTGDTMIRGIMSRPQFDVLGGKKIALSNPNYKADIFQELIPHLSFAVFLWLIVGAAFYYTLWNLKKQIQLNALRDEFVGNITHELKTPITTAGVALETLNMSDEMRSPQSKRYLEICQSELKRLSILVERILHNKSPQIHYEKIDMRQVLEDVMYSMKVQFDMKGARVEVIESGDGFQINGDKSHLSSVLYNLLENALKYSSERPAIQVYLQRQNGSVKLDVKDNGIGIDPGYHEKIFERLYRVPNDNRHDVKGHGLGLSYVADVVKKHHGMIELESSPGKGSTFSLKFPAWHEN